MATCCCNPPWHATVAQGSEEHTSELQSPCNLVCRLLLEKKKKQPTQRGLHSHDLQIVRGGGLNDHHLAFFAHRDAAALFFFFKDPATPGLYPLPLNAPLPI